MLSQIDILADLHTHTLASRHAHSTVKENITAAEDKGLSYLAITDHLFGQGTADDLNNELWHFVNPVRYVSPTEELGMVWGVEINAVPVEDQPKVMLEPICQRLRWRLLGLHLGLYPWSMRGPDLTLEGFAQILCDNFRAGYYNAIAHIERDLETLDGGAADITPAARAFLSAVCTFAAENDVVMEVNESSFTTDLRHKYISYWLGEAKKQGCHVSLGSDAHYCGQIGRFSNSIKMLNELEYPRELILNCNEDLIRKYCL